MTGAQPEQTAGLAAAASWEAGAGEPRWLLRWTVVALLMLAAVINYIDRQTLSVLAPTILRQFHLSNTQFGWMVFSFSLAYMVGAPLTGRFLDRVGVRAGLALAVAAWSLVAGAHMAAAGLLSFCVLRAALGLCEAAVFPAGIKGARKILRLTERAAGLGLVFSGSAWGASLAPFLVVPLALRFGWRWAFLITGSLGFFWLGLWWAATRARGTEVLGAEAQDADRARQAPTMTESAGGALWPDPRLWAFLLGVFCVALPISFGYYWLTLYVVKVRGMALEQARYVLWIPYISSHVGTIGLGSLSGLLIAKGWSLLAARRKLILVCGLLELCQLAIPRTSANWEALGLFALAGVANGGLYTLYYAYITDHFPSRQAGLLTGLGTMAYSACATISGPIIGWTVDRFSYTPVLFLSGLLPFCGTLLWWRLGGREANVGLLEPPATKEPAAHVPDAAPEANAEPEPIARKKSDAHAITRHIGKLRELEASAQANPGHEVDHDHESTPAFDAYAEAWQELAEMIEGLPQPEGWLELERWCDTNPHEFGNVVYPGAHRAEMGWNPQGLSVRGLILTSILRWARQLPARPEDEPLWTDPRVVTLLRTWAKRDWAVTTLAQVLVFLPAATVASITQVLREQFILLPARTLLGHRNIVFSVRFSPDGMLLASGSSDDTAKLWDAQTGELQRTIEGHRGTVLGLAFSPDGQTLASGSVDATVRLWDARSGELKETLPENVGSVHSVAFSPDGGALAIGGGAILTGGTVSVWNRQTGKLQWEQSGRGPRMTSVSFSPDNRTLAGGTDENTVELWEVSSRKWKQTLKGPPPEKGVILVFAPEGVCSAFSPDGRTLASGSKDKTVRLWDTQSGELKRVLKHDDWVYSVAFSPDGKTLASAGADKTVKLWDAQSGKLQRALEHQDAVESVAFSPDGSILASGTYEVNLWDARTGRAKQTLKGHHNPIPSLAFSPDGKTLVSASPDGTAKVWDAGSGELRHVLDHEGSVYAVAFSPDGRTVASGGFDKTVRLWEAESGKLKQTLTENIGFVKSLAFSPDGQTLAIAGSLGGIVFWDAQAGSLHWTRVGHTLEANGVAFSPDARLLASGGSDDTVKLWDALTGELRLALHGHSRTVHAVAFSPDGTTLASASSDGVVKLWDPQTGELKQTLTGHRGRIHSAAFTPDGTRLASGGDAGEIIVWEAPTGARLRWKLIGDDCRARKYDQEFLGFMRQIIGESHYTVRSLAFSPDGRTLAAGCSDGTIKVWDFEPLTESS